MFDINITDPVGTLPPSTRAPARLYRRRTTAAPKTISQWQYSDLSQVAGSISVPDFRKSDVSREFSSCKRNPEGAFPSNAWGQYRGRDYRAVIQLV